MKTKVKNMDSEIQHIIAEANQDILDRPLLIMALRNQGIEVENNASISKILSIIVNNGIFGSGSSSTEGSETGDAVPEVEVPTLTGKIYGIKIDKANSNVSTRIEYVQDAAGFTPAKMNFETGEFDYGSWSDVWFVRDNYPVMVKYDGTEDYRLDPNDYSKKLDGTPSDIKSVSYEGNVMSRIPLIYLKLYEEDGFEYILVSDTKHDDTWFAYAHMREDETIADSLYLSTYKSYLDGSGRLRSLSGQAIKHSLTAEDEIAKAEANGIAYSVRAWAHRNLINMLLLILGKSEDAQAVFGNGNIDSNTVLPTGTLDSNGQFFGYSSKSNQVKVFHIEGWWGDIWERIQGIATLFGVTKVRMSRPYNVKAEGYTDHGAASISQNGYIKENRVNQFGRFPTSVGGSATTYTPDQGFFNTFGNPYIACFGGSRINDVGSGPSSILLNNNGTSVSSIATGLFCLPPLVQE